MLVLRSLRSSSLSGCCSGSVGNDSATTLAPDRLGRHWLCKWRRRTRSLTWRARLREISPVCSISSVRVVGFRFGRSLPRCPRLRCASTFVSIIFARILAYLRLICNFHLIHDTNARTHPNRQPIPKTCGPDRRKRIKKKKKKNKRERGGARMIILDHSSGVPIG